MAIRLKQGLTQERVIPMAPGATMTVKAITYADLKAAEQRAFRLAQDELAAAGKAFDRTLLQGEDALAYQDELNALAESIMLDRLVERLAIRWEGVVVAADGEEAEDQVLDYSFENWKWLKAQEPFIADRVSIGIRGGVNVVDQEGNGSAPSSDGG